MTTSLYGTSYSSIYAKELKNIRAEQEVEEEQRLAKKEGRKVVSAGGMHAEAYIGKGAKTLASKKLEEAAQFVMDDKVQSIKKFEGVAGKTPELFDKMGSFGDVGKTAWEGFESYTGMSFSGEATQLTPEYITAGLESGSGVSELGIGELTSESLFPDIVTPDVVTPGASVPTQFDSSTVEGAKKIAEWKSLNPDIVKKGTTTVQQSGAFTDITSKAGDVLGKATLQEGGKVATELSKTGIEAAAKGSATASVGAVAGQAAAGIGIATGGYQAISGFAEGDIQSGIAGTAKAVGGAMMFTPLAPIGLALSGVGTLLDFV